MKFKFLKHTADVKFQAFGKNVEEVFENSALALKESICGKIKVKSDYKKKIKISGKDFESLLYKFLEEIIYLLDGENFLISKIENLEIKNMKLTAEIFGDKTANYRFTNKVKAVTYNDMFVENHQRVLHSSCTSRPQQLQTKFSGIIANAHPTTGSRRSSFRENKKWIAQVVIDV